VLANLPPERRHLADLVRFALAVSTPSGPAERPPGLAPSVRLFVSDIDPSALLARVVADPAAPSDVPPGCDVPTAWVLFGDADEPRALSLPPDILPAVLETLAGGGASPDRRVRETVARLHALGLTAETA
jgi:hypothetical protein